MLHPKTDEHPNPRVEAHHLVGKLSTAETLLTEVQRTVPTCPGSFLVINVCNQGNNLCSPCTITQLFRVIYIYIYIYIYIMTEPANEPSTQWQADNQIQIDELEHISCQHQRRLMWATLLNTRCFCRLHSLRTRSYVENDVTVIQSLAGRARVHVSHFGHLTLVQRTSQGS